MHKCVSNLLQKISLCLILCDYMVFSSRQYEGFQRDHHERFFFILLSFTQYVDSYVPIRNHVYGVQIYQLAHHRILNVIHQPIFETLYYFHPGSNLQ